MLLFNRLIGSVITVYNAEDIVTYTMVVDSGLPAYTFCLKGEVNAKFPWQLKSGLKKRASRSFGVAKISIHFGLMMSRSIMKRHILSSNAFCLCECMY